MIDRREISFEQAEGLKPMPRQLALREVPQTLRARLWATFLDNLRRHFHSGTVSGRSLPLFIKYFVEEVGMMRDDIKWDSFRIVAFFKRYFVDGTYGELFGVVEWFIRNDGNSGFVKGVKGDLVAERAAYRVVDNFSIVPVASEQDAETYENALKASRDSGSEGARTHLLNAGSELSRGEYASSVRESIHAIESVLRTKTGEKDFAKALRKLDESNPMHGAFRVALEKLYGYASDEQGVRHSLLGDGATVTERDALFFLSICSAFLTYVANNEVVKV